MTSKLEKCLRLISVEDARIELTFTEHCFSLHAMDGNDGEIASGVGNTLEEATDVLYANLSKYAERMSKALAAFAIREN